MVGGLLGFGVVTKWVFKVLLVPLGVLFTLQL